MIIWLTGRSGAGKTTLARELRSHFYLKYIFRPPHPVVLLDGDELRAGLCNDLDFAKNGRTENCRRAGEVAILLEKQGFIPIVSLISPMRIDRNKVRRRCKEENIKFVEVYVKTDIKTCEKRDPKKLYAKARVGKLPGLLDSPYQKAKNPEVIIDTTKLSIEESILKISEFLLKNGLY